MNKEYSIGDKIEFRDIDIYERRHRTTTGYILEIKPDGSFIAGNIFVPIMDISKCLKDIKHPLNRVTLVARTDLAENLCLGDI